MTMAAIATIVSLLSVVMVEYQEVNLINKLNEFFNFDHNIYLLDASVDINRFVGRREIIPRSLYVFKSADVNITGLKSLTDIKSKNTFMVVVPESSTFDRNLKLLNRLLEIQKLQIKMKIGMFFPHFASTVDLEHLFRWCKKQLIVNIFAAAYLQSEVNQGASDEPSLNIFTFHPFGTFEVANVTGSETYHEYFLSLDSNFHEHQLRLGHSLFYPPDKELWFTVIKLMNASFSPNIGASEETDINPYVSMLNPITGYNVYPSLMETHMIIVPEALPYSGFSAYLQAVTSNEFCNYSLITIGTVILLLSVIRYIKQRKISFFESVADVLNLLINDNGYIQCQRLSREEVFIIVPLTFVGLVIVNGILSILQSYLARPILQPQINTIDDIYRSPFPIVTFDKVFITPLIDTLTNLSEHYDWSKKVIANNGLYYANFREYNRSAALLIDVKDMNLMLEGQKRLNIKIVRNPGIQVFKDVCTYFIVPKFLFFQRFNDIVQRVKSAGLYDLWEQRYTYVRVKMIVGENIHLRNQIEIVVENFEFPMLVVYGWFASIIVFFIEIICKKFKLSQIKTFRNVFIQKSRSFCRITSKKTVQFYVIVSMKIVHFFRITSNKIAQFCRIVTEVFRG